MANYEWKRNPVILAGMFARSNMGMPRAEQALIVSALKGTRPWSARDAAIHFCEEFMETNEHEDIFAEEAEGWLKDLKAMPEEQAESKWPDVFKNYDAAAITI